MKKNGRILGLLLAVIMAFSMIVNVATIHAEENGEPINETPAAN